MRRLRNPGETSEEEERKSEAVNEGKDEKEEASEEVTNNPSEKEKAGGDEETPKSGGMLLFGTLFKYMDKEKEEGTEKSAEEAKRDNIASVDEKVELVKESKSGEVPEPDLTTPPPPPQEEMDTA